jgi:hypothetical protein
MKKVVILFFFSVLLIMPNLTNAHPGNTASDGCHYCWTNCASWGEVYGTRHCHGGSSYTPSAPSYSAPSVPTCPSMSSYDFLSGGCKCYSGYVVGTDFLGKQACVSADSKCTDSLGYGAEYNSLSEKCECKYGYIFNGSRCESETSYCNNLVGLMSRYDSLSDSCKCLSGYVIGTDSLGRQACVSADSVCRDDYGYGSSYNSSTKKCECSYGYELTLKKISSGLECALCSTKYGIHSSYNALAKKCECNNEYTLDDSNQCVEKQNNVYFKLDELDADEKKAIIRSDYDNRYYLVEYGFGCYSTSFSRYINKQIVVNLGTDFGVDRGDKIVLQDDNENCEIKNVEKVDSDFTLFPVEESYVSYVVPNIVSETKTAQNIIESEKVAGVKVVDNSVVSREKSLAGATDKGLIKKLKGKILLQVESVGEAWYVNPKNEKKYYMANGDEAYNIMRDLGVGIVNKDLEKVKSDKNFAKKHSGKIFLQVEDKGQAYYIDFNGEEHYLKNGEKAYDIMRELGLGITNNDIRKIDIDEIN